MKAFDKASGVSLLQADLKNGPLPKECADLTPEKAARVLRFHRSLPFYRPTPLVALRGLAKQLGVRGIYVKDESKRFAEFGLNAFKGLGGIFAVGQVICQELGLDPDEADFRFLRDGAPGQPLVYLRRGGGETLLAAVNPTGAAHPLPEAPADGVLLRAIGQAAECRDGQWILPPVSAAFLRIHN